MAETPDIRILVGNLGDADKSGASANLIRRNLETALGESGVKVKIVPDLSGLSNSDGISSMSKRTSALTSNAKYAETQLASLSVKWDSLQRRVESFKSADLKSTALTELQRQYDALEKEITEYGQKDSEITAQEQANIQIRIAALNQLASEYAKLDAIQDKTASYVATQKYKASSIMSGFGSADTDQAQQAAQIQAELNQRLDEYAARKTEITEQEKLWVNEQISAIQRLYSEHEKLISNVDKVVATQKRQLASLNQYLTTVNPKALTEFAGQISNLRSLLSIDTPEAAQAASTAMTKLKAEIKAAGYEGGNAITYIQGKMQTFATYLVSSAITMGAVNGVKTMIQNVKDLDASLTDLRIVTGATREETQELLKTYNQMAQQLGSTTANVSTGAVDWLRQGYNEEDARELLTQSMTLSIVGAMDSADATDALTAALKGYQLQVEEASDVVDKFFKVDMSAATSSSAMATALAKTAANAKLAGLSLDDVIGQLAVVNETLKEAGESTGTFYNTMLSRIGALKSGRLSDPETDEDLNTWGIAA